MSDAIKKAELLPCPFCGKAPNSGCNYGIGGAYVNCVNRDCGCNPEVFIAAVHNPDASLSLDDALVKAKTVWNTRAGHLMENDGWTRVEDGLPNHDDDVLMAYEDSDAVIKGKYFNGGSTLTGFAAKSARGNHYAGKPLVAYWMLCPKSPTLPAPPPPLNKQGEA